MVPFAAMSRYPPVGITCIAGSRYGLPKKWQVILTRQTAHFKQLFGPGSGGPEIRQVSENNINQLDKDIGVFS